ncbi:hypothetical protein DUNSADRAFT_6011, partial [Dunaliella salina]
MERNIAGLAVRAAEQHHLTSPLQASSFLASCLYSCCSLVYRPLSNSGSTSCGASSLAWKAQCNQHVQPLQWTETTSSHSLGLQEESIAARTSSQYQASVSASTTTHASCASSSRSSRSRSRSISRGPCRYGSKHGAASQHTPQNFSGPGFWRSPLPITCSAANVASHSAAWGGLSGRTLHSSSGKMQGEATIGDGDVAAELPTQEVQKLIIEQLQNSFNVSRIKEILKLYDSRFDQWTLAAAMDHMVKLPVDQRRATDPDTKDVKQRLSALYMHLLPDMDPCRSVKLLQTLAQLSVCMHEPGRNQEGFTV